MKLHVLGLIFGFLFFCGLIQPSVAFDFPETSNEHTHSISSPETQITGFTLNEDTISHANYYVPWGTHIFYENDGKATLVSKDGKIEHLVPTSAEYSVPKSIEIPSGARITYPQPNRMLVQYYDLTLLEVDYLDKDSTTTEHQGNISPSWVMWAEIHPKQQTSYKSFTTRWIVPPNPQSTIAYNPIFIFNGFTAKNAMPSGFRGGIVQPVLSWNCEHTTSSFPYTTVGSYCTNKVAYPHWTVSATYVDGSSDEITTHGTAFETYAGHLLEGKLEWLDNKNAWQITITDLTSGKISTLFAEDSLPNTSDYVEPVITLETTAGTKSLICPNGANKGYWPATSQITFTNLQLLSTANKNIISTKEATATDNYNDKKFNDNGGGCGKAKFGKDKKDHYYVNTAKWTDHIDFQLPTVD